LFSGGYFSGYQIELGDAGPVTGTVVEGNLVGTDVTGLVRLAPTGMAPVLLRGTNNTISGTAAAAPHVQGHGIIILTGSGNFIQGNFIGIDVTGTTNFGCNSFCIQLMSADNTVGGSALGAGNRIGGANTYGLDIAGNGSVVQGNFIGTDETGT